MIEQAMYFTLGSLIAALSFVALLPLLQRRAARLTRRRLESRMPASFEQIDAQHSMVRAQCALRELRMEQKLEALQAARTSAMSDAGRSLFQAHVLEERLDASTREVLRLKNEARERTRDLTEARTNLEAVRTELGALRLEKDSLAQEFEILSARLAAYESRHAAEPNAGAIASAPPEASPEASPVGIGGWDEWADQAGLEPLDRLEAFAFLRRHVASSDSGVAEVVDVLGCTPLTLQLAAAYCRRMGASFSAYAANARAVVSSAPGQPSASSRLAAAFALSMGAARRLSETTDSLVAFLGLCANDRVPLALVEGVSRDPAETKQAVRILTDLGLAVSARFGNGAPALRMPQAFHALARERAARNPDGEALAESLVGRLAEIYPADAASNPESRPLCEKLTPHLLEACATSRARAEFNETRADLLVRAGDYRLVEGDHAGAEALFTSALSIREKLYGASHPETAASLDNLATARCAQGDFAGARAFLEQSRRIFETTFGLDYPATARRQASCARMLLKLGQAREALALAEAALDRLRADGRSRHPWTIEAASVVADALEALGKKKKAAMVREEFSGAAVVSPPHADGLVERLLERLHGLVWGRGYAARNHH